MRTHAILLVALVAGCGSRGAPQTADGAPPLVSPITVRIENHRAAAVFVEGNLVPFRVREKSSVSDDTPGPVTSTAVPWSQFTRWEPLCTECSAHCSSTSHAEPAALYLELAAGQSVSLEWEGRLYRPVASGCSCGISSTSTCVEPHDFGMGSYLFTVPFATTTPARETLTKQGNSDGLTLWRGSGIGFATLDYSEVFAVEYRGEREIILAFR